MSLQTQIFAQINATETKTPNVGSASASQTVARSFLLATGTQPGQADLCFSDKRTITASAVDMLDLNGVLSDVFGSMINAAHVKAILIIADAGNSGKLTLSGVASKAFNGPLGGTNPTADINPGGLLMYADPNAGWVVTPATADTIQITNTSANAANYEIAVIAASA